jgi:class 3 adenylate cyclase
MVEAERLEASERRVATVLFADISGFTSLSERLDPEEVTEIMNACFDAMGDIVSKQGGTIDKFIGDCLMAVFGVPQTLEKGRPPSCWRPSRRWGSSDRARRRSGCTLA